MPFVSETFVTGAPAYQGGAVNAYEFENDAPTTTGFVMASVPNDSLAPVGLKTPPGEIADVTDTPDADPVHAKPIGPSTKPPPIQANRPDRPTEPPLVVPPAPPKTEKLPIVTVPVPQLKYQVGAGVIEPYVQGGVQFNYSLSSPSFGNVQPYTFGFGIQFMYQDPPTVSSDPVSLQATIDGYKNNSRFNWNDPSSSIGNIIGGALNPNNPNAQYNPDLYNPLSPPPHVPHLN